MKVIGAKPDALRDEKLELRPEAAAQHEARHLPSIASRAAPVLVLAVLFAVPALRCVHDSIVIDPDIWWHLRTGDWILQHRTVPQADPFSAPLAGRPWQAYSWLFDLFVSQLFHRLGLVGIVTFTAVMLLVITAALYHLIRRLQPDLSLSVLLTFFAGLTLSHLESPRPWLFTIFFFILEIDILMHVRTTGKVRELVWLPVIFALWANLHIQFIDGLLVLIFAAVESVVARWHTVPLRRVNPLWFGAALLASLLATLANPYGWRIYRVAYDLATQPGILNKISELQAIPFRDLVDFSILLLALAAAATLGRSRPTPFFEAGLLLFAAVVSFRSQRDVWVMAIVASIILANAVATTSTAPLTPGAHKRSFALFAPIVSILLAAVSLFLGFRVMHVDNAHLSEVLARDLPVKATAFVQQHHLPGPLYNDYNWGGYLIWSLKMPVSIDGRAALYGTARIDRSLSTWNAQPDWTSDTQLSTAALIIGPVRSPLTQLLRLDTRFQLAYEDKLTAVFIPHNPATKPKAPMQSN